MRAFAAVPIAIAVCIAVPVLADASSHITAAKKAERKSDWRKALQEWKAAYAAEPNAEYLIGIGDAYSHLGNKAEAKKNYDAYLADPLALPGVDLPAAAPPSAMPPLPGLELPGATGAAKKGTDKVASATAPPLPLPGVPAKSEPAAAPKKDAVPAVADGTKAPAKPIAMVPAAADSRSDKAPVAALTATPAPQDSKRGSSGGIQRTMAYVTAGVAVAALGGGALAFTKANSAQNDLTGGVHSSAQSQQLLDDVNRNKTLSVVGFAGGLVAAGIAAALFAF